jgi:NADPH2:quinone reductase
LFKAISEGILHANINAQYALRDAVKAHQVIENGKTFGATVLIS